MDLKPTVDKSVMEFVLGLLKKYKEMEDDSKSKYIYCCHNEFDAGSGTDFEHLSNNRCIVVKTKLNPVHMVSIMGIFQSVYDINYWRYEDLEHNECYNCDIMLNKLYEDYPCFEEMDEEIDETSIPLKYSVLRRKLIDGDVGEWFKLYTAIDSKTNTLKLSVWSDGIRRLSVDEEIIYFNLPKKDEECEKAQKVYTLSDIIKMLEDDMKSGNHYNLRIE